MTTIVQRFAGLSKFLTALVVLALIAAAAILLTSRDGKHYVTVDFPNANSVYKGSDVRILGVPVGVVEEITPKGDVVKIKLSYDGDVKLPDDVTALIISPSIVGDRYVQLAPAYTDGAVLPDNASVDISRTEVPIELDQVYQSLDDLAVALGPEGANKDGSLNDFIDAGAKTLDGQGVQLNETIKNFSKLSETLSNNKDDLFGSIEEVETFVAMLKKNDSSVRSFNDSTAEVAEVLEGERDDLAGTLKALGLALNDVHTLIKDNRSALRSNVDNLTSISEVLADNQKSLAEVITAGPTALSNVAFTYNGKYGSLDTRADLLKVITGGLADPQLALCGILGETGKDGDVCSVLGGILEPVSGLTGGLADALPRAAVAGSTPASEPVHDSIQQMLAVDR